MIDFGNKLLLEIEKIIYLRKIVQIYRGTNTVEVEKLSRTLWRKFFLFPSFLQEKRNSFFNFKILFVLHLLPGEGLQGCATGLGCSRPAVQCFSTTGTCLRPPSETAAGSHSALPCPLQYRMHTLKFIY